MVEVGSGDRKTSVGLGHREEERGLIWSPIQARVRVGISPPIFVRILFGSLKQEEAALFMF